jgi:hypothetical protein
MTDGSERDSPDPRWIPCNPYLRERNELRATGRGLFDQPTSFVNGGLQVEPHRLMLSDSYSYSVGHRLEVLSTLVQVLDIRFQKYEMTGTVRGAMVLIALPVSRLLRLPFVVLLLHLSSYSEELGTERLSLSPLLLCR